MESHTHTDPNVGNGDTANNVGEDDASREDQLSKTSTTKAKKPQHKDPRSRKVDEKKPKLRTSKDVYDRLKWAAESTGFDVTTVYIGYKDRFLGMCELAFNDYDPNESDIPYTRIYYFRSGGPPVCPIVGDKGEICVGESNWPESSVIQWDRNSRTDLVFKSGDTLSRRLQHESQQIKSYGPFKQPQSFDEVPFYKFDSHWKPVQGTLESTTMSSLKIVCLNVLFELYDPEIVQCNARWPYIIEFLENTNADLIALQEVTPPFMSLLQSQPWVQQQYYLTDTAKKRKTIYPYGQILLSKFPPAAVFLSHNHRAKRWVIPTFLVNHQVLQVPVIHLKSDHNNSDHSTKRREQLLKLISACGSSVSPSESNVIILGDTNFQNGEVIEELNDAWIDVWPFLKGTDQEANSLGWTLSTKDNPLANEICKKVNALFRFDRIFFNGNSRLLKPLSIQVVAKEVIDFTTPPKCLLQNPTDQLAPSCPLPLSDHYGLECEFQLNVKEKSEDTTTSSMASLSLLPRPVVYTSAVVIIPPDRLWEPIQKIRSEFDPHYERWMPHINLLYGFVPDTGANFDEAYTKLTEAMKKLQPFQLKFSNLAKFGQGKSNTVYIEPNPEDEVKKLQALLMQQYPFCSEQSEKSSKGFTPHLSIGNLSKSSGKKSDQAVTARMIEWSQELFWNGDLEFLVDCVHIISRSGDQPFQIRKTIFLGGNNQEATPIPSLPPTTVPAPAPAEDSPLLDFVSRNNLVPTGEREALRSKVFEELQRLCNHVLNEASHGQSDFNWESVHVIGSGALNCHTDQSDIDALCCGFESLSHEQFFEALEKSVPTKQFEFRLHHVVLDTLVPIAKLSMDGIEIDLVYTTCPTPWNLKPKEVSCLTDTNIRSIAGVRDVTKLNEIIPENWRRSFQTAVRAIKYWAKARYIYSKGFGCLGGYPWSLLVAYVIKAMVESGHSDTWASPEKLVEEFFYQFANWKWPEPVEFNDKAMKTRRPQSNSNIPELMPILAPAYPYNNSARNVTRSTRSLVRKEFKRGHELLSQKSSAFEENWNQVAEQASFFEKYSRFIQIEIRNASARDSQICGGFLDSKLVSLLVYMEKVHSAFVQPFTKVFSTDHNNLTVFVGLEPQNAGSTCTGDLADAVDYFHQKFQKWQYKPSESVMYIEILDKSKGNHCDILKNFIEILLQS